MGDGPGAVEAVVSAARRRAPRPRAVLLVGAGRFGREHLATWLDLQRQGRVRLAGVVLRTQASADALAAAHPGLACRVGLSQDLLAGIDAVDVATPADTHARLVAACLPHADVLCEKPLAPTEAQARTLFRLAERHGRRLQVVHNYLLHPALQALQAEAARRDDPASRIEIRLSNPADQQRAGECPFEQWLHAFYLLRALGSGTLRSLSAWRTAAAAEVSLALAGGQQARLSFGWQGRSRQRSVELRWPDLHLRADLDDGQLLLQWRGRSERRQFGSAPVSLMAQARSFVECLGRGSDEAHRQDVLCSLRLMERARSAASRGPQRARSDRPRVLVVGGGVFGSTCAIELARANQVVLAERHAGLLTEASWLNQWRHHAGFHYPRSLETIEEVRHARAEFESVYEDAIARDVQAYYAVSAFGHEITRERYLAVCRANRLQFRIVRPPAQVVHADRVQLCLLTDEAVVRMDRLRRQIARQLGRHRGVDLRLGCEVIGGRLLPDGRKAVRLRGPQGVEEQVFDGVVNATYAGTNRIAGWFGFPVRPMRFDLLEMALLHIAGAPRVMMTILDGPFTSLTHTGAGDLFMLSHIHQSLLASVVTADGLPPRWPPLASNRDALLAHGLRYLPLLERARFVESRIGVRVVEAYSEDFDGRPTVVTAHGFGCWSVLGGKIITSVSNAREIVRAIARETG